MTINITGNLSQEPIHYVYLHRRNDTGIVFYIGKGKNKRAWSKSSRNKHWKHITDRYGYDVEIIKSNLTELEAFELEIETISQYGIENLVNLTIGGHTSTGYRHTDEARQKQSEIAKKLFIDNPEWRETILQRIHRLNKQQKDDPLFYQRLGESNSAWYNSLSEEQKIAVISKKTNWLKDEEKVLAARKRKSETCKSEKYLENQKAKAVAHWLGMSPVQQQTVILKLTEAARRRAQRGTGVISTSTTYLVNRQVLVPTIGLCVEKFGGGIVAAIREMRDTGRNLTIFKGFVFEVYNKEIHTLTYDTDITKLVPLKSRRWNPKSAVKSSDGRIFLSITAAADSFGERKTNSTADWISRCIKSNRDAMGFYWSRPTTEECEQKIISLLNEQRESFD